MQSEQKKKSSLQFCITQQMQKDHVLENISKTHEATKEKISQRVMQILEPQTRKKDFLSKRHAMTLRMHAAQDIKKGYKDKQHFNSSINTNISISESLSATHTPFQCLFFLCVSVYISPLSPSFLHIQKLHCNESNIFLIPHGFFQIFSFLDFYYCPYICFSSYSTIASNNHKSFTILVQPNSQFR